MGAAVLAMLAANSPLARYYDALLSLPFEVRLGSFGLAKPLLLWINDGLMAVFFFLVGMEFKREGEDTSHGSMLRHLEHTLHPWVAFGVLPVFAFANADVADYLGMERLGILLGTLVSGVGGYLVLRTTLKEPA